MVSERVKIDIVSGFLGAGKTTFIKKLLSDVLVYDNIVVLENEFGEINIDGDNLSETGIKVESLMGGCICCTSSDVLPLSILSIINRYKPERIIIEPTGIARLSDVRRSIAEGSIARFCELNSITTIVDVKNYKRRIQISKNFFEDQIRFSECVFLSKMQNIPPTQIDELIVELQRINPDCRIIKEDWTTLSADRIKQEMQRIDPLGKKIKMASLEKVDSDLFGSLSYEEDFAISPDSIQDWIKQIGDIQLNNIERIKGTFTDSDNISYSIEYVLGDLRINPMNSGYDGNGKRKLRVTIIGTSLDKVELNKTLLKLKEENQPQINN